MFWNRWGKALVPKDLAAYSHGPVAPDHETQPPGLWRLTKEVHSSLTRSYFQVDPTKLYGRTKDEITLSEVERILRGTDAHSV